MPIEDQGKLDLIVHKMTDLIAKIERGDVEAEELYKKFIASIPKAIFFLVRLMYFYDIDI
jgi:hypothetical protein